MPRDLAARYSAFLSAPAGLKEKACDALIGSYLPRLRAGEAVAAVDSAIITGLPAGARAALAARLAIAGVFSPLQEACLAENAQLPAGGLDGEFRDSAAALYRSLRDISRPAPGERPDWSRIAEGLLAGWRFFPSTSYVRALESALRKAGARRALFEFKAARYIDESDRRLHLEAGLFLRWLFLPGRKAFREELAQARERVQRDIDRSSPGVVGLPRFGGEVFFSGDGSPRILSFSDPRSPIFHTRAIFSFFDTTCAYCVDELVALGRTVRAFPREELQGVSLLGLKIPSLLPPVLSALQPFEKRLSLPFTLLENRESKVWTVYRVHSVPLLLFLDERGTPLWSITFRGKGRLEEKLRWYLDDLLADARCTFSVLGPDEGSLPRLDLYLDPSCAGCRLFLEETLPSLAASLPLGLELALRDCREPGVAHALQTRLLALRELPSQPPVAILEGRAFQGHAALAAALPAALQDLSAAGSRQRTKPGRPPT